VASRRGNGFDVRGTTLPILALRSADCECQYRLIANIAAG
jgi:hypothetical protein